MATKKSSGSSTSKTTTTTPKQTIGTSNGQSFFVGGTTTSSSAPKPVAAPKPATVTKTTKTSSNLAPGVVAGFMDGSGFGADGKVIPSVKPVSPVTTSDPARDTYAALKDKINKLGSNTLDYSSYLNTSDPMSGLLNDQRKSLQQRKTAEIGRIQSEYSDRQAGQVQQQKSETGTQSMGLARIGGFDSASGQAVLTNLQRTHEAEQNTLMQARQSAILQAQQAYEDKDFALAKLQIDEAKAAEALMYNRSQDFIRNSFAMQQEERANAQFEYGKTRDTIADERAARQFAVEYDVTSPAYTADGKTVINTQTGKGYTKEEDFFADFGFKSWDEVPPGFIQKTLVSDAERVAERNYQRGVYESDRSFGRGVLESDRSYNRGVIESDRGYGLQSKSLVENEDGTRSIVNLLDGTQRKVSGNDYWGLYGPITGENGSPLWKYGLDVDLKIGDPVFAPGSGTVIDVVPEANSGGFGNQVKIRMDSGEEVWLSHLAEGTATKGQKVNPGDIVGVGGNTGNTIPGKGGDGSHLDFTVKDAKGNLMSAPQAKAWANSVYDKGQSKYTSEFEARVDYDKEINDIVKDVAAGDVQNPSQIISVLVKDYGKYVSQQEIVSTINGLFGKQIPQNQSSYSGQGNNKSTAQLREEEWRRSNSFAGSIKRNLGEFGNTLIGK